MDEYESLSHSEWECKYHVVFIPKYRRKTLYGELRRHLGEAFRNLAKQKECMIVEGHIMPDHVHMFISTPPSHVRAQRVRPHGTQRLFLDGGLVDPARLPDRLLELPGGGD